MKIFCTFVLIQFFVLSSYAQTAEKYSKSEVLQDLSYLRESLEAAHFDLFRYTSEADFEWNYQQVKASITADSLSYLDATKLFQAVVSKVNNGHTEIPFPGQAYGEYAYAGGTIFPLELAFEEGKALVKKNFSDTEEIQIGTELISINGKPIEEILKEIYPQVSAERLYFKLAKIELFSFPRYYWLVFGQQEEFEVGIKTESGIKSFNLKAVPVIEGYEMKRSEIFHREKSLTFFDEAAYLKIGSFSGDEADFRGFVDSAFAEIKKRNFDNLIIDLRNNDGGNDSFSDYLVSYFADRPFRWNSSYSLKTSQLLKEDIRSNRDTTNAFWASALNKENGTVYPYEFGEYDPQPKEKRFEGNVYVLVNRQSHSQSAVTAAQIQDYDFATIVGEETGEYPSLMASVFYISLPNTAITLQLSKGYLVRVNGSTKNEGVIPDILIRDHLLDEKDEVLEGLLERLEAQK
ncbi:S41 family peptidase [uncultured Algoriphagus sp.]|jgi:hypothetical protein|uniref:S41 family peptidase n=1 Tax=uncultured Algoriphagus sp. TaxID=417365 RepID=UPI00106625D1|nr:S41 family peptidase [uncultured Algoriphagus sp.]